MGRWGCLKRWMKRCGFGVGRGTARWDRGAYIVAVHAELPSELHPEIIQLFRAEAAHLSRASPLLDSGGSRSSELAVSRFRGSQGMSSKC